MADEIAVAPTADQLDAARKLIESTGGKVISGWEQIAIDSEAKAPVAPLTAEEQKQNKGPGVMFRAWEQAQWAAIRAFWSTWNLASWGASALKGLRTFLFFGVSGAGALYSSIEGIDVSGVASKLTGLEINSGDLLLGMSIVGFGLRMLTDSSAFKRWSKAARGDGEAPGVGSGDVDEPENQ